MTPNSLPKKWIWLNLEDICNIERGVTFPATVQTSKPSDNNIACLRTTNIQEQVDWNNLIYIPKEYVPPIKTKVVQENDILMSIANSKELVGKVAFIDDLKVEATFGGFISVIRATEFVDAYYLYSYLRSDVTQRRLRSISNQTTNIANLTTKELSYLSVPVPPLPEQRRIAAILRQADTLRQLRSEANEKLENLSSSIFLQMFGSPSAWKSSIPLGELVGFIGGGTPSRQIKEYFNGHIPWATSKDVKSRYLHDAQEHITEEAIQNSATNLVPSNTILVVVKSKILMHSLPIGITTQPFCFGQDVKGLVCKPGVVPQFIVAAMLAQKDYILAQARGVNTEGLTLEVLSKIPIPKVDIDTQEKFRNRILAYDNLDNETSKSRQQLAILFSSLVTRAFTGELTAPWREKHEEELQRAAVERDKILGLRGEKPRLIDYEMGRVTPEEAEQFRRAIQPLTNGAIQAVANAYQPILQAFSQNLFKQTVFTNFADEVLKGLPDLSSTFREVVASSTIELDQVTRRSLIDVSGMLEAVTTPLNDAVRQSTENFYLSLANQLSQIALTPPPQPHRAIHESLDPITCDVLRMAQYASVYFRAEELAEDGISSVQIEASLHLLEALGFVRQVEVDGRLVYRLLDEKAEVASKPNGLEI